MGYAKYILIFLISASSAFAAITFNLGTSEVTSITTSSRASIVDENGGDVTTEAGATKIYVPIDTDIHPATPTPTAVLKNDYTVLGESFIGTRTGSKLLDLPRITPQVSGTPSDIYADNPRVRFSFTTDSTAKNYFYMAARDNSGTYKVMGLLDVYGVATTALDISTDTSYYVEFTLKSLCERGTCNATLATYTSGSNNLNISQLVYFFTADETLVVGDTASPATFTDGSFAKILLTDVISTTPVSFQSLRRGDTLAIANFSGISQGNIGEGVYKILAFMYEGGTIPTTEQVPADALDIGGNFRFYDGIKEGDISLALVNKFKFVSKLTAPKAVTPEKIEAFINKQSCYLFSAGFQTDHYVLTYFRYIRDTYLLKNGLGKLFVKWYYQTAPHWTKTIYTSESISFMVRTLGYFLYYVLNYFFLILAGLIVLIFSFRARRV